MSLTKARNINKLGNVVKHSTERLSCNHFCCGKTMNIKYFESVCLQPYVSRTPFACAVLSSVALPEPRYFFRIFSQSAQFSTKYYVNWNMCFDFLCNVLLKHLPFYEAVIEMWSKKNIVLHVKYRFFLSDFKETWFFYSDFPKKISNNKKIYENPPKRCRVPTCRQTDIRTERRMDRWTVITIKYSLVAILRKRLKLHYFLWNVNNFLKNWLYHTL